MVHLKVESIFRKLKAIGSLAFNLLQFIGALIAIITTSVGAAIIVWIFNIQRWIVVPLIAFALGIFVTLVLVIFLFLKASPPRWLLRGYRYVHAELLYTIHADEPSHHTFTLTVEIEAIQPGISIFEETFRWTGQGREEEPTVVSPGHIILGEIVKRSGWKYYYIYLGRELSIGERVKVKIIQELYDLENRFEPFLAKTIAQPVDRLTLQVVLPKDQQASSVSLIEWNTVGPASMPIRKTYQNINPKNGEILWKIESPILGHRYEARWEY